MADERGYQAGHEYQGQQGRHRLRRADADDQGPPEPQGGDPAAIADRDSDKKLYIKMDGQTIASPTISSKIDSSSVNIENNFTEQVAENYAILLNAGALPVTLTVSSAPAAGDTPLDGDGDTDNTGDTGHGSAETPSAPSDTEFADMKGHWAESALRKGIELGLLKGSNGKMLPNDPVRGSEALTILNRALGASPAGQHGLSRRFAAGPVVYR